MAKDFLLEIGVEELPPDFIDIGLTQLEQLFSDELKNNRLEYSAIETKGTPRRLVIIVRHLSELQASEEKIIKGPPYHIAYHDGELTKAGQNFLRKFAIDESDLIKIHNEKGDYIGFRQISEQKSAKDVLLYMIPEIFRKINFPKNMHWDTGITFARPIRWICCIFGDEPLNFEVGGVKASNRTIGHRFLSPDFFEIRSIDEYVSKLKKKYVVVDVEERKKCIVEKAMELLQDGETLQLDEQLLETIANLTEYPTPFVGEYSADYLSLPMELISTVLKKQQFLIPVEKAGNLTNKFVGVRNGNEKYIDIVRRGNERVVFARLSDALFFYNEDTKHPLSYYTKRLKGVILEKRLGTVFDKVQRLKKISAEYTLMLGFSKEVSKNVVRAAELCKSDLVTNLVFEFTELQGIIGREYALKSGEQKVVADAIFEHYLPRFRGDQLPVTQEGIVLSLAEKFDNIVAFFGIGEVPGGSKDPYALRRQALGIIQIIIENKLRVKLSALIKIALNNFPNFDISVGDRVHDFIIQRLNFYLKEQGFSYDTIAAVIAVEKEDIVLIKKKIAALERLKREKDYESVVIAFSRPTNILKQGLPAEDVAESLFSEKEEKELYTTFNKIKTEFVSALKEENFEKIVRLMLEIKPYIDRYFDNVFVNVEDERIKSNRLGLMKKISELFFSFADFTKLVIG